MDVINQFLTMPMMILCLVISVLVVAQRSIVEFINPKLENSKAWRDIWLPLGPAGTGALVTALLVKYPYPDVFALSGVWGRVFCGIVCGLCSGLVYRLLKQFFTVKLGQKDDCPPDPGQPSE